MEQPDVTVVVVTWNALPWLEQCLDSVRGRDVVVVDNGSTDETVAFVREHHPDVRVIQQENKGMGGGNNAGMRVAAGRYFFLLNSDAWVLGRRARQARAAGRRASGGRRRRSEAAEHGRHAAAVGARRADAVGARDRVPVHPQARSAHARPEPALPRRLRARRAAPRSTGSTARRCSCGARPPMRSACSTRTSSCSARRSTG